VLGAAVEALVDDAVVAAALANAGTVADDEVLAAGAVATAALLGGGAVEGCGGLV
jgi:hypothetical protein